MKLSRVITSLNLLSREGLALLFGLVVVFTIAVLSYRSWDASARNAVQGDVTRRLIAGVDAVLLEVGNAETGQRGFLLTGQDRYLAPYLEARQEIPRLLTALKAAAVLRRDQAQRLAKLADLIDAKLVELALTVELRRNRGFDAAVAVVLTDRGRELMEQIRAQCAEILVVTNSHLAEYSENARSAVDQGVLISSLGGAGLILLLLVAHVAIQKEAGHRLALIDELRTSERRLENKAEEAEAANRTKSIFLSTMSHEIRTPLNAILGYAQLMARDPSLKADSLANLHIIGRSGEHLLALINDVLDMSKIEAGRIELKRVTFNLHAILRDLAAMFRLRAEAKGLRFELVADGESVPYVNGDEGKMRQSLINLLGNAIKFTKRGQVRLHVTIERRPGEKRPGEKTPGEKTPTSYWFLARIEDTGPGISEQEQQQLFQPFRQAKRGINVQEGTGLGLAISRQFARLMGGDLTVSSQLGQGAIFRFEVPIESGDEAVAIRRSAPRRVIGIRAGTGIPKILVVDDQFENRDWLLKLLTSVGFSAIGAENGDLALQTWESWSPDLILMDVHMPVMDGLEATRRIKEKPGGKDTLIVVLTASALDEDRRNAAESRADGFLSKPLREDDLLEKMGQLLDVVYDYRETSGSNGQATKAVAPLNAEMLRRLPLDLVEKLREATQNGNKKSLDALIQAVSDSRDAGCAQALSGLADKYEYDALTRLLDEACRR